MHRNPYGSEDLRTIGFGMQRTMQRALNTSLGTLCERGYVQPLKNIRILP